ncbi:MAG TPA: restriction endonuclease, partial [Verrucomicrobia subdivision 3 bacterium]|nr:restriction endonuclease [Limisphaerales bacterium]
MSEWRDSTWGEEISLEYGKSLRGYDTASGKIRVFGSNGPIGWTTEPLASGPGVILGRKGAYRGVEFSRDPFFVIDTAYYVVPKTHLDMRWLYYAIKHHKLGEIDDGSPIPSTTRAAVYVKDFQVAPLAEQRAIAAVLGSLDDKIELNRRMNETLEALAQSLFKSWFVDAYLRQGFGRQATQSTLPKGWCEVPFTETVEIIGGGTPKTSVTEYWGGDILWFSVVDSPQGSDLFVIDTEKRITKAGVENSSTQVLPVGTTIITARGTVGKIALVGVPMAMNQSCYGLRGKAGENGFHTYFVTRALVSQLQQHAHGSVFDTITRDTLAGVQVALPPAAVVEQFEEKVSPLMERIRNNLHESCTLAALRDALLPK